MIGDNIAKGLDSIFKKSSSLAEKLAASVGMITEQVSVDKPELPPKYNLKDRGITLDDLQLQKLKPLLFSEISNRDLSKKELEARVITNTILNRMSRWKDEGKDKTIEDIINTPKQYQGVGGNQYKIYESGIYDAPTKEKVNEVNSVVDKIFSEIKSGSFKDNTNGAAYYTHKPDGSIIYDDKRNYPFN